MIGTLLSRFRTSPQVRESAGVFASRMLGLMLSVVNGFLLARGLGSSDYGLYAYAFSLLSILLLPVQLGLTQVVLRESGKALSTGKWGPLKGLRIFSFGWTFAAGSLIALGLLLLAQTGWIGLSEKFRALILFSPILVIVPWAGIQLSTLQGLQRVVLALFPFANVLLLFGYLLLFVLGKVSLSAVAMVLILGHCAHIMFLQTMFRRTVPASYRHTSPEFFIRAWLASAIPIFVAGSLFRLNSQIDVVMLGYFRPPSEVGIYRLTLRVADFIAIPLQIANASIAPRIVGYFVRGEMEALARWIRRFIRIAFVAALLIWLGFALTGRWILGLAEEAYRAGYPALLLLGLAQLVNVAAGSVGWVLQMTHNEKDNAVGVGAALLLNVLLNALLTPRWGFMGTAVATALSLAAWNLILTAFVWKRFRIRVGVL